MQYQYICQNKECEHATEISLPIGTDLPKVIVCEKCESDMKHNFREAILTQGIRIPYGFKAVENEVRPNYGKFGLHEKTLY
jgi:hypothetical protein